MLVVAGLSLKNLEPCVWKKDSPYFLRDLRAVMVSYADFVKRPSTLRSVLQVGLRRYLGIPDQVKVYLDNGSFGLRNFKAKEADWKRYEAFVEKAKPDWWPVPRDYIPLPSMNTAEQEACFNQTMQVNHAYRQDGFVPVVHVGPFLQNYVKAICVEEHLHNKPRIALGGIVPNLLRASRAMPYDEVLKALRYVRSLFLDKELHVFGLGGTATIHLAALLGIDSADSSGWRNRAARGIIQLPGSGERVVAELGNWRGRRPSEEEWEKLASCRCPPCRTMGGEGLEASGRLGFRHRAAHNLWILLEEAKWVERHISSGTYGQYYERRLNNSVYLRLIKAVQEPTDPL